MIRNLGTLLLLATAAFAQSQTAQTSAPAKPATVSVKPASVSAKPAATAKPAPHAAKASAAKVTTAKAATPVASSAKKPKVISAKAAPVAGTHMKSAAKPATVAAAKPVAVSAHKMAEGVSPKKPSGPTKIENVRTASASARPAKKATAEKSVTAAKVKPAQAKSAAPAHVKAETAKPVVASVAQPAKSETKPADEAKKETIHFEGRRDPFLSPVVAMGATGSGCSTGKRCLAIDQIALKGVLKSEAGMIAVVVNSLEKAYFLRENDPVFNGYVVKITGDSIVFKETFHDRLGKTLTRDVTKTITRPAV